jgi:hypothetical protein
MVMGFKIGDKVRVVTVVPPDDAEDDSIDEYKELIGCVGTINHIDTTDYPYMMEEIEYKWRDEELVLLSKLTVGGDYYDEV